jgi:hypothetical protein
MPFVLEGPVTLALAVVVVFFPRPRYIGMVQEHLVKFMLGDVT